MQKDRFKNNNEDKETHDKQTHDKQQRWDATRYARKLFRFTLFYIKLCFCCRFTDKNDIQVIEDTVASMDRVLYGGVRQSSTAAVLAKATLKASADPDNPKKRKREEDVAKLQREAGTFLLV